MKTITYPTREAWLDGRRGKITGSGLGDIAPKVTLTKDDLAGELERQEIIFKKTSKKEELEELLSEDSLQELHLMKMVSQPRKMGYYELIADKISVAPDDESPMARGTRLEPEVLERFAKEHDLEIDTSLVMWVREDNENIAVSPDGFTKDHKVAVDGKCLSNAKHVKAYLTQEIPDDYEMQKVQYFIVNDDLDTLHFAFYNPRIPYFDFFCITIHRKDVQREIDEYLMFEKSVLQEVEDIVVRLTF